jgi:hypothetical protein
MFFDVGQSFLHVEFDAFLWRRPGAGNTRYSPGDRARGCLLLIHQDNEVMMLLSLLQARQREIEVDSNNDRHRLILSPNCRSKFIVRNFGFHTLAMDDTVYG